MNKKDIIKVFNGSDKIKRTILNYKSTEDLKRDILNAIKENGFNPSDLKETKNTLTFKNNVWFKNVFDEVSVLSVLPFEVKGKNIKEYGSNWLKTDFALYEVLK